MPCPSRLLDKDFKKFSKSELLLEDFPNALIKLSKLDFSDELSELELLLEEDELLLEELNCEIRLCNLLSMSLPLEVEDVLLVELLESFCDWSAAIKLCKKESSFDLTSEAELVLVESEEEEVDEVLVELESPRIDDRPLEIPADFSALSIAPKKPPPSLPWRESSSGLKRALPELI